MRTGARSDFYTELIKDENGSTIIDIATDELIDARVARNIAIYSEEGKKDFRDMLKALSKDIKEAAEKGECKLEIPFDEPAGGIDTNSTDEQLLSYFPDMVAYMRALASANYTTDIRFKFKNDTTRFSDQCRLIITLTVSWENAKY